MRIRRAQLAASAGALAVLLAIVLTGFGGVAPVARACTSTAGTTARISVGARTALVHLPRARRGRVPLILALHGAYGSGAFMERYSGLSRLADREGFGVVYPDAAGTFWRISASDSDVRFLDALLDQVLAGGCFDARRVSVVGVSNGGGMAARFACAGDDRLAGLVTVAGAYGSLPECRARRPLSVLEIHGTADKVVPYEGIMEWVRDWAARDGCPRAPRSIPTKPGVLRLQWAPCRDGTAVAHLRLLGGTHAWPGADPPDPGPAFGVSAASEAWAFLHGRTVPQHEQG